MRPPPPSSPNPFAEAWLGQNEAARVSRRGTRRNPANTPPRLTSPNPPSPHPPADGYEPRKVPQSFIVAVERRLTSPGKRERGAAGSGFTPSLRKVAVRSKNLSVPAANGTSPQNHCSALGGQSAGAGASEPRTMDLPPPPHPRPPLPAVQRVKGEKLGKGSRSLFVLLIRRRQCDNMRISARGCQPHPLHPFRPFPKDLIHFSMFMT